MSKLRMYSRPLLISRAARLIIRSMKLWIRQERARIPAPGQQQQLGAGHGQAIPEPVAVQAHHRGVMEPEIDQERLEEIFHTRLPGMAAIELKGAVGAAMVNNRM